jgi:hypothetical protein
MKQYNAPAFAYILCGIIAISSCLFLYTGVIEIVNVQVTAFNDSALNRLLNKGVTLSIGGEVAPWPVNILVGTFLLAISATMFVLVNKKCV